MVSRPALAPGVAIYRRSDARLQIGLNPAIVVDEVPGLEAALALLDGINPRARIEHALDRVLDTDPAGFLDGLISARVVLDTADPPPTGPFTVDLVADGPCTAAAGELTGLLGDSGIVVVTGEAADHVVVLTDGEPSRGLLDRLRIERRAHTVFSFLEHHIRWGPTITEPHDPCWGCVDAHLADRDPAWPALTTQFGRPSLTPALHSVTAAHRQIALGCFAHDLALGAAGRWRLVGRLSVLRDDFTVHQVNVPSHPECGCALLPISHEHLS